MADDQKDPKEQQPPAQDPPRDPPKQDPPRDPPKEPVRAKQQDEDASSSKDPQVDDRGMISLPQKSFVKKVANMTARELRKIFGTSDVDKIVAERKEHEDLKKEKAERDAKDEKARRASMKEEERLKEDNAKLARERDELRDALAAKDEERIVDRQQHYLEGIAGRHVDGESVEYALSKFKRKVRAMTNAEVEEMDEAAVQKWFQDWAKDHPKHAREAADPKPKDEKPKVPLSTSKKPKDEKPREAPAGGTGQKKPIDMSPAELKQYMRERGHSMW